MWEGGREGEADHPCRAVGVIGVRTAWSLKDKLDSSVLERLSGGKARLLESKAEASDFDSVPQ